MFPYLLNNYDPVLCMAAITVLVMSHVFTLLYVYFYLCLCDLNLHLL